MMTQIRKHGALCAPVLLAFVFCTSPCLAGAVSVSDAWIRALPDNLPAGGYFTLHNDTDKSVTLTGASSPACGMLMLHQSVETSGMSSMNDVPRVEVAPGATLSFAPGGYHLMCMEPTALLKQGATVPVTLDFGDGSKTAVEFSVRSASGR
jgi:copper(I)-binding protein